MKTFKVLFFNNNFLKTVFLFSLVFFSPLFFLQASSGESVDSYNVSIEIQEDSSIEVQETIQYNFGSNLKKGIYRTIPTTWRRGGKRYHLSVSNIRAFDDQGNNQLFDISRGRSELRIDLGSDTPEFTGSRIFIIEYRVEAALEHREDYDALLWNAIGSGWNVFINNPAVLVKLPQPVEKSLLQGECFVGREGSTESCADIEYQFLRDQEENLVSHVVFRQMEGLSTGEGLTVDVFMPKGLVSEAQREEVPSVSWLLIVLFFGVGLIPIIYTLVILFKDSGDPGRGRAIVTQYDVPAGVAPANAYVLLNRDFKNSALVAELLSLAIRGYIRIVYGKTKVLFFFKKSSFLFLRLKSGDDLSSTEKMIIERIFDSNFIISKREASEYFQEKISGLKEDINSALAVSSTNRLKEGNKKFFKYFKEIRKIAKEEAVNRGYFKNGFKSAYLDAGKSAFLGVVMAALLTFVPLFIYLSVFQKGPLVEDFIISFNFLLFYFIFFAVVFILFIKARFPGRSEEGAELRRHLYGLRHYIRVAEKERMDFHFDPKKNPELFEKLLPYAVVLGEQKRWVKHLSDLEYQPDWYRSSAPGSLSVSGLNSMVSSLSSTSSSAGGSGGVGGGAGGGGGGSR